MRNIIGQLYANHKEFSRLMDHMAEQAASWPVFDGLDVEIAILDITLEGIVVEIRGEGVKSTHTTVYIFSWTTLVDAN